MQRRRTGVGSGDWSALAMSLSSSLHRAGMRGGLSGAPGGQEDVMSRAEERKISPQLRLGGGALAWFWPGHF